jgi:hypothetical protein
MDIGELEQQIRAVSTDPAVQGLANQLAAWKDKPVSASELVAIERYIGNIWIRSSQDHERVYALWSAFKERSGGA